MFRQQFKGNISGIYCNFHLCLDNYLREISLVIYCKHHVVICIFTINTLRKKKRFVVHKIFYSISNIDFFFFMLISLFQSDNCIRFKQFSSYSVETYNRRKKSINEF